MERARFGIFAFTPSTGELRRDGKAVRLQAQPARVLARLVARPGEIVTRETLQREIWNDGTHVDFERGLNFCIAQVRSALGDSAESPRFIETVPKQGYRFIAPVSSEEDPPAAAERTRAKQSLRPRKMVLPAALAVVVVLITAVLGWARMSDGRPTVVVIPFYNETGRPELDPLARSIGDAVTASLAAPDRVRALSVIGNAPALHNPFARTDVQAVAKDLSGDLVVIGQLQADGTRLRVIAHLIRASDMKHLWAQPFDDTQFALDAQTRTAEAIASAIQSNLASR